MYLAPCRKKKAVHKTTSTDDKRLQNTLKRLGVNTIPGIEEVNIFMDDTVIHFSNPKGTHARQICSHAATKSCMQQAADCAMSAVLQFKRQSLRTPTW